MITPGGTSNPVAFTYVAAPTLTALVPSSGRTSEGTVVTLTGTNLATASAVTFGGTAVSVIVVSDTQITAVAPAGPVGPAPTDHDGGRYQPRADLHPDCRARHLTLDKRGKESPHASYISVCHSRLGCRDRCWAADPIRLRMGVASLDGATIALR